MPVSKLRSPRTRISTSFSPRRISSFQPSRACSNSKGKWKKAGEQGHVILGGLDGDDGACKLIREGYVDSTGVQDVYLEAKLALDGILEAIAKGEPRPNAVKLDPGFALSAENYDFKGANTWGCMVLDASK